MLKQIARSQHITNMHKHGMNLNMKCTCDTGSDPHADQVCYHTGGHLFTISGSFHGSFLHTFLTISQDVTSLEG